MSVPRRTWTVAFFVALVALGHAQEQPGANVVVSQIHDAESWGSESDWAGFSVGTTACNVGSVPLSWEFASSQHPVIAQNVYRLKDGRFEQIGLSWLKHGVSALNGILCGTCQPTSSTSLGIGCSDPYSASMNGFQQTLGPRSDVNASTGVFLFPPTLTPPAGLTAGRLRIAHDDIDPALNPTAEYFVEAHYVTADEGTSPARHDNASWRRASFDSNGGGGFTMTLSGATAVGTPALAAWQLEDPEVSLQTIDIPGDGRVLVGFRLHELPGGIFRSHVVLQVVNSERGIAALDVTLPPGANVTAIEHREPVHHSGELWSSTPWLVNVLSNGVRFAVDPASMAPLRWGTAASFSLESDGVPLSFQIEPFGPGTPSTIAVPSPVPPFRLEPVSDLRSIIDADREHELAFTVRALRSRPDVSAAHVSLVVDGGAPVTLPVVAAGPDLLVARLPALPAGVEVSWVARVPDVSGETVSWPSSPARRHHQWTGVVAFEDAFEVAGGFSVVDDPALTDGSWERGIPLGGGLRGDPAVAFSGAGACFLTANRAGNSDVDGGASRLVSPSVDLLGLASARLGVALWNDNATGGGPGADSLDVEFSPDDGITWLLVESVHASPGEWMRRTYTIEEIVPLTAQFRVRITAQDLGVPSIVECGVDDVFIVGVPSGPSLGRSAAGTLGFDALTVNGESGGAARGVAVVGLAPLTIELDLPLPLAAFDSAIFGRIGPNPELPTVTSGTLLSFPPSVLLPGDPSLFCLMDSTGFLPALIVVPAGSFTITLPVGLPPGMMVALQGVIFDGFAGASPLATNAILLTTP